MNVANTILEHLLKKLKIYNKKYIQSPYFPHNSS